MNPYFALAFSFFRTVFVFACHWNDIQTVASSTHQWAWTWQVWTELLKKIFLDMDIQNIEDLISFMKFTCQDLPGFVLAGEAIQKIIEGISTFSSTETGRLLSNKARRFFKNMNVDFDVMTKDLRKLCHRLANDIQTFSSCYPDEPMHVIRFQSCSEAFGTFIEQFKVKFEEIKKNYYSSLKIAKGALYGLVAGSAAIAATPLLLGAAGFGSAGVVGGSLAASVQSLIYGGSTTGLFSLCQSAGAAGLSTMTTTVVPAASCAMGGLVSKLSSAPEEKEEETRLAIPAC